MSSRISLGLRRISRLLKHLRNPQDQYEIIHVAGTNGKGSVAAMVANTLSNVGLSAGLFTSPHLTHRWDGISIDGQIIPRLAFMSLEKQLRPLAESVEKSLVAEGESESQMTTFELMTAAAFEAFKREQVDLAVIEVGLGGTEDATNVVNPLLSVITSIGLDHTAFLGTDVKSITTAKGGIIKADVPVVVSSDQEYTQVFGILGQIQRTINGTAKICWTPPNSTLDFRISNANTARTVLQQLRGRTLKNGTVLDEKLLSDEAIEEGIRTTQWRGRCRTLDLRPLGGPRDALIDGAHNAQSIDALASVINRDELVGPRTFVFAMTTGKDPRALKALLRPGDRFFAVEFEPVEDMAWIKPLSSAEIVSTICDRSGQSNIGVNYGSDVAGAIKDAADCTDKVIICGSLYLVGQVYRMLESAQYEGEFLASQLDHTGSAGPYDPEKVESRVRQYWQNLPPSNEALSIYKEKLKFLLPPPNVTGSLHIGHALTIAIQDAYARYFQAKGNEVTWIPGLDHAGIATQSVVSKHLAKSGINSSQLTRAQFLTEIWKWRTQFDQKITGQIQRLGTCLNWEEEYFTMDRTRSAAVVEAFRRLWNAGLIRREKRMVNWSIGLQSVISDIEVEETSIEGPTVINGVQFGKMWRIKYELTGNPAGSGSSEFIEVDTTRPETVFGDRAIAVHPEDMRYSHLVGYSVRHPLLSGVTMQIIADSSVNPNFGTGCVKLTPAHDVDDYQISRRHQSIPLISVYDKHGKMLPIEEYPQLTGLDRLIARKEVLNLLSDRGSFTSEQPHKTTLNFCSRTSSLVEPTLLPQWFIKMSPLASTVLERNDIKMTAKAQKEWTRWLSGVQDWCVSRQLVWGHQVPLYRVVDGSEGEDETWIFAHNEEEAREKAHKKAVVQDTDVLDTWFSSGILPLSAFGWPENSLSTDHQLEFIESGPDILFFWLARMAMLCTFLTDVSPFKEIVLHPLVRDSQGRKMSKSLGNVIDPLSIIQGQTLNSMLDNVKTGNLAPSEVASASKELKKTYPNGIDAAGSDALRFALIQSTTQSEALKFDMRNVVAGRYFCTKLWNAVNFYKFNTGTGADLSISKSTSKAANADISNNLLDQWILSGLANVQQAYASAFSERDLSAATESLRYFFVDKFCDVYLEFVKVELRALISSEEKMMRLRTFRSVLEDVLKLAAPFLPYLAEDLWHLMGNMSSIHRQRIPEMLSTSTDVNEIKRMDIILSALKALRTLDNRTLLDVVLYSEEHDSYADLSHYATHLKALSSVQTLTVSSQHPSGSLRTVAVTTTVSLSHTIPSTGSSTTAPELTSAQKRDISKLQKLEALVEGEDYQSRVPEVVKQKHREQIEMLRGRL